MSWETILPVANRSGSGTSPAETFTVAAGTQMNVKFRFPMADADILDPLNGIDYEFQLSQDNVNFTRWIGPELWRGGEHNRHRITGAVVPASCSGGVTTPGNWYARIVYTILRPVQVGLDKDVSAN